MPAWWWLWVVAAIGAWVLACAAVGLAKFSEADWFTDPGPYAADWEGYDQEHFAGLAVFTFCAPVAVTLLFTAAQQTLRVLPLGKRHAGIALLSVFLLLVGAVLGALWAAPLMQCYVVGCVDPATYAPPPVPFPEAGVGWQAIVGLSAIFAFVGLAVAQGSAFLRNYLTRHRYAFHAPPVPHTSTNSAEADVPLLRSIDGSVTGGASATAAAAAAAATAAAPNNATQDFDIHNDDEDDDDDELYVPDRVVTLARTGATLRRGWVLYALLFPPTLLFYFVTMYIPNSWEYFTPDRIASYAAQRLTHDPAVYAWPDYISIPEYSWATFWTKEIVVHEYWRLKVFPDNLFFFVFLLLLPLVALIVRSIPALHDPLRTGLWLPSLHYYGKALPLHVLRRALGLSEDAAFAHTPTRKHRSLASLGVVAAIITVTALFFHYWVHDHNYNGYWPWQPPPQPYIFNAELVARAFGQLAVLFFSLLMFPAARNSALPYIFGVSWEAAVRWHVVLGRLFLLASFAHMVGNYVWYAKTDSFPRDIFAIPMHLSTSIDNFTVPLISLATWLSFITMGILGLWTIRRRFFELFYYAHHITYCILIPAVLWHAAAGWEFLLPGVALWFFDRCVRAYRSAQAVAVIAVEHHDAGLSGGIVTIRIRAPFNYHPGQYVFLNVAELSLFEWHPFTISGANAREVELMIKTVGAPTSFTNQLAQHVAAKQPLTLSVDGPYGLPLECDQYTQLFLVCGGIGITPGKSIFEALVANKKSYPNLKRVVLLWSARDRKLLDLVASQWAHLHADRAFHVKLFLTASAGSTAPPPAGPYHVKAGRPSWRDVHDELDRDHSLAEGLSAHRTLVFACGPRSMVAEAYAQAVANNWDFHEETFEL